MSTGRPRPLLVGAAALLAVMGLLWLARTAAPAESVAPAAAVGFLLLAGTLASELLGAAGIPHLTGYLLAGIFAGPHVLHLVDHEAVEHLDSVTALALALIALAGGAELEMGMLKRAARSLAAATLTQTVFVMSGMTLLFVAAQPLIGFTSGLETAGVFAVGILWGVLSLTRSPAATLAILSQTRATGPLASFSLGFIMTSDLVVIVLLAGATAVARTLLDPSAALSLDGFRALGHELLGSISIGTTLGLVLAAYLRAIGRQFLLVLLALGFVLQEVLSYLAFEPLLAFLVAGFVVRNLSAQGERLLHEVEKLSRLVFVLFFATAGAHLDLDLVRLLWPVALVLCGGRVVITWAAARLGARIARDPPVLSRWGWSGLVSQAGLALGIAAVISRSFPSFGDGFRALAIATVSVNELLGPVLFKIALDRAGETR